MRTGWIRRPPPIGQSSIGRAFRRLSPPIQGAIWMVMAATCFTAMLSTIRFVAQDLHPFEIAFFRYLVTMIWMAPTLIRFLRTTGLAVPHKGLYGLRALFGGISTLAWFYGVPFMPLSDAIAINFTAPLWATVFAALILHEIVRLRRWSAVILGFVGVLIVLRPGFVEVSDAALILLLASAAWGSQHIVLKMLSRTEPVNVIVAMHAIMLLPLTFIASLFFWTMPTVDNLIWLAGMGTLGTLGHIFLTRAFAAADASIVLPFDFAKMPIAVLIGWFVFGEPTDVWTWVGATVIVASTGYIARREAQIARLAAAEIGRTKGSVATGPAS